MSTGHASYLKWHGKNIRVLQHKVSKKYCMIVNNNTFIHVGKRYRADLQVLLKRFIDNPSRCEAIYFIHEQDVRENFIDICNFRTRKEFIINTVEYMI